MQPVGSSLTPHSAPFSRFPLVHSAVMVPVKIDQEIIMAPIYAAVVNCEVNSSRNDAMMSQ